MVTLYSRSHLNKFIYNTVGKIAKKQSKRNVFFVNSALKIQCHDVKNTLLQTAFSANAHHWKNKDFWQLISYFSFLQ